MQGFYAASIEREPDVKSLPYQKNLAGIMVNQGRMREALPFAKKAYNADKKDIKGSTALFKLPT